MSAAETLGYSPNSAARRLRTGRPDTVLMLTPALGTAFLADVHASAVAVAAPHGINVAIFPLMASDERSPLDVAHPAVDGVLGCSVDAGMVAELVGGIPAVLLDSAGTKNVPGVEIAFDGATHEIVKHLAGLGHRRVGHLAAGPGTWTFQTRHAGLEHAAAEFGVTLERFFCVPTVPDAFSAAMGMLSGPDRPSAVVCDTDNLTEAVYLATRRLGLEMPRDVSLVGIDDTPSAEFLEPSTTSLRLPAAEVGRLGMTLLMERLAGRPAKSVVVVAELIARGSTGPIRAQ